MFSEMRRKDREIPAADCEEILYISEYGCLSTICDNGYPYVVPLNYVYYNNHIYFHCAYEGQKLRNISNNSKVSFCVVGDTELLPRKFSTKYNSVIIFGTAKEADASLKEVILQEMTNKYSSDFKAEGKEYISKAKDATQIMEITIEHMTGKARR